MDREAQHSLLEMVVKQKQQIGLLPVQGQGDVSHLMRNKVSGIRTTVIHIPQTSVEGEQQKVKGLRDEDDKHAGTYTANFEASSETSDKGSDDTSAAPYMREQTETGTTDATVSAVADETVVAEVGLGPAEDDEYASGDAELDAEERNAVNMNIADGSLMTMSGRQHQQQHFSQQPVATVNVSGAINLAEPDSISDAELAFMLEVAQRELERRRGGCHPPSLSNSPPSSSMMLHRPAMGAAKTRSLSPSGAVGVGMSRDKDKGVARGRIVAPARQSRGSAISTGNAAQSLASTQSKGHRRERSGGASDSAEWLDAAQHFLLDEDMDMSGRPGSGIFGARSSSTEELDRVSSHRLGAVPPNEKMFGLQNGLSTSPNTRTLPTFGDRRPTPTSARVHRTKTVKPSTAGKRGETRRTDADNAVAGESFSSLSESLASLSLALPALGYSGSGSSLLVVSPRTAFDDRSLGSLSSSASSASERPGRLPV